MTNKFKNLETITGYNLSGCYYKDDLLMIYPLKLIIIEEFDYSLYSFMVDEIEVIRTIDFYRLLLNNSANDITNFVCDEVLYQVEEIGSYLNEEMLKNLDDITTLLPLEENLSDQFYAEGLNVSCESIYNDVQKVKKRKNRKNKNLSNR